MTDYLNRFKQIFAKPGAGGAAAAGNRGFTLIEVLIAASIMIILCVGTLSVFSYAIKLNTGNNMRSQALTVLQAEAEFYRSLKFKPSATITDTRLIAGDYTLDPRASADGTVFNVTVSISNISHLDPANPSETNCTLKQIVIRTVMANPQPGWLANLRTELTILRVRAN
jgi:prepilin-type N-terminal cleavage/methylation domain-containing protein